ncbi:hypothetical protein [Brachyspira pilosicoli]|uniref:hypothetical protein n=1 Tax=Brachyspira pilosicoli TaxID=52584 RepID=UPI0012F4F04D|nr:hypothetical protein [Brachyspira pilosicoli]WIH87273.1 hypothetical protein NEI05_07190 [Brachyspira pilosicoli]
MSKRVLRLVSILFLSSILVLSCSNANKTGSGDNNSGNGGSGTGGDGGTTPTPEGIAKYAGTWTAKFTDSSGGISTYYIIIGNDGNVKTKDDVSGEKAVENIMDLGNNTFSMTVYHSSSITADITIVFIDSNSGTINDDAIGNGVIRKQNNGNKGLWYYEGTWTLTANQQPAQAAPNPTITIGNDGSVTYSNEKSTDVTDKGNETYEVKFTPEGEGESIITLKFTDDSNGSFTLSIPNTPNINGTMTKQQQ